MPSYNTSELKKGLKVLIEGDPYLILECNFVKPGKGQALYRLRLRNLLKNTVLDRTYKSGDSVEGADVKDIEMEYLYQDGQSYVFMDPETYEQPAIPAELVGSDARWLQEQVGTDLPGQPWLDSSLAVGPHHGARLGIHLEPGPAAGAVDVQRLGHAYDFSSRSR